MLSRFFLSFQNSFVVIIKPYSRVPIIFTSAVSIFLLEFTNHRLIVSL